MVTRGLADRRWNTSSPPARQRSTICATKSSPFSSAAIAPRCRKAGTPEVLICTSLASWSPSAGRMGQPADAPAGHRPRLGEAVQHQQRIVRPGQLEERRRDRPRVDQPGIDLVGHDPEAALAGEIEQRALLVGGHGPARRIARRVDEDRARAVVDRVEHLLQVERPAAVPAAVERHVLGLAAHQPSGRGDVRPDRRDDHDVVARIEQQLAAQQDRLHAAGRHRDAVGRAVDAVEPLGIGRRAPRAARACRAARYRRSRRPAGPWPPRRARSRASPGRPRRTTAARRRDRRTPLIATSEIGVSRESWAIGAAERRAEAGRQETGIGLHASDLAHRPWFRQPAAAGLLLAARPSLAYR